MTKTGRRFKYIAFIDSLEDSLIYSPATIVRQGELNGLLPTKMDAVKSKAIRRRIRHTLARLSSNRNFPFEGDGWVELKGQAPLRGWYGWRWKMATSAVSGSTE